MNKKLQFSFIICTFICIALVYNQSNFNSFADDEETTIELTDEEKTFLKEHPIFHYGMEINYAPIEYLNSDGEPKGFGIAYLKKASELLGVTFEPIDHIENYTWDDCMALLANEQIDLMPAMSVTEERMAFAYFTDPYLSMNVIVIGNNDRKLILSLEEMQDDVLVFPENYWQNDYVRSKLKRVTIVNTESILETLDLIDQGKGDYTIIESTVYSHYLQKYNYKNLKIVGELPIEAGHCIGISKNNLLLRDILNKVINYVNKEEIYREAFNAEQDQDNTAMTRAFIILSVFLSLIIFFLLKDKIASIYYKKQIQTNKKQLIENLSHDLKTPLSILKVHLKLLQKGMISDLEKDEYYNMLEHNVNSLDNIINDLYDIAHIEEQLIEKKSIYCEIGDLLENVCGFYKESFTFENKILLLELPENCKSIEIKMNYEMLHRALSNLLSNALKYSNAGDRTEVRLSCTSSEVIITIVDTGIGIEKDCLPHIFDRFYQVEHDKQPGKGLGLSITKEIIKWHKGSITVKSKFHYYTKFKITLPI